MVAYKLNGSKGSVLHVKITNSAVFPVYGFAIAIVIYLRLHILNCLTRYRTLDSLFLSPCFLILNYRF